MQSENRNPEAEDEKQRVDRRLERLSLQLHPPPPYKEAVLMTTECRGKEKLEVKSEKLTMYMMRGKHRDIQEKVVEYFRWRPELVTPVEISKDEHRDLSWRQLWGLVREAGIRPFRYVSDDPEKYFAIGNAIGSIDISLAIKFGVQYRVPQVAVQYCCNYQLCTNCFIFTSSF